jgi:hypothetical protein
MKRKSRRSKKHRGSMNAYVFESDVRLVDPREDGRPGGQHAGRLRVHIWKHNRSKVYLTWSTGRGDATIELSARETTDLVRALRAAKKKLRGDR